MTDYLLSNISRVINNKLTAPYLPNVSLVQPRHCSICKEQRADSTRKVARHPTAFHEYVVVTGVIIVWNVKSGISLKEAHAV